MGNDTVVIDGTLNTVVLENTTVEVIATETHSTILTVEEVPTTIEVLAVGPQGPKGDPGEVAAADNFFQVALKFVELDTEQKRVAARENLGVQIIDGGVFT